MKQKLTIKSYVLAFMASFISLSVILSSAHLSDIARASASSDTSTSTYKVADPASKAIGDLHNHTDKQTVKPISTDQPMTVRGRELKAHDEELASRNIIDILEEMALFYRFALTLPFSLATR